MGCGWLAGALLIAVLGLVAIEGYGRLRATALVDSLKTAEISQVPAIIRELSPFRRWALPQLRTLLESNSDSSPEKLHASLALLSTDPTQADYLGKHILDASRAELLVLTEALRPHRVRVTSELWTSLDSAKIGDRGLLPVASVLATYDPGGRRWIDSGTKVASALVASNPLELGPWIKDLREARTQLIGPLRTIFSDKTRPQTERMLATTILADYTADEPALLADLLMDSDLTAYSVVLSAVERQAEKTLPFLESVLDKTIDPSLNDDVKDSLAARQARAAVSLVRLGNPTQVWSHFRYSDDPRLRSYIVNWLKPLGAEPRDIAAEFDRTAANRSTQSSTAAREKPPEGKMKAILFDGDTSRLRALILALGDYPASDIPPETLERMIAKLLALYCDDPDAGIHGCAEWTLKQWNEVKRLVTADADLKKLTIPGERRWFVNREGQSFVMIEGPVQFLMGSSANEPGRTEGQETQRRIEIPRRFALATKEVTVDQFRRFIAARPEFKPKAEEEPFIKQCSPSADGPWIGADWYASAAYCNWLSEQEGLPREQWCYMPNQSKEYADGMTIPANVLERTGYRLPTQAELEFACRAGTVTSRYYGASTDLLAKYAWYRNNSKDHAWPVGSLKPNDLGLFDMLGNVYERSHDADNIVRAKAAGSEIDARSADEVLTDKRMRIFLGGSWTDAPTELRAAARSKDTPLYSSTVVGFRVARTMP